MAFLITPTPYQTVLSANGVPVAGALISSFLGGTSTPTPMYTDSTGTVATTQPLVADAAGRWVTFLDSNVGTYKFVITDSLGVAIRTVDGISVAGLASSAAIDIQGVAGQALSAGKAVYLSAGDGALTAGRWYLADAANPYSSSNAVMIGMTVAAISSGVAGTIRVTGIATGLSGLTAGTIYYVGTSGALTATPSANPRIVGIADSTTSLVLSANPATPVGINGINDFRLTLESGVPVSSTDQLAKTSIFCTPFTGNRLALFDSSGKATIYTSAEFSIALPVTNGLYDLFCFASAGVPTLEIGPIWATEAARATNITRATTGVWTKTGDLTRRYLGTFRYTTVAGQTEDSFVKRLLYNASNRVRRPVRRRETNAAWTYNTATIRQARASALNQIEVVNGLLDTVFDLSVIITVTNDTGATIAVTGIGEGLLTATPTTNSPDAAGGLGIVPAANMAVELTSRLTKVPPLGYTLYCWMERANGAGGNTTWYGVATASGEAPTGLEGTWEH